MGDGATKSTSWKTFNERRKVVQYGQRLARSGRHADHTTILPLLEGLEGFEVARVRLEERAIRTQLDQLCALARQRGQRPVEAPLHASTRA